MEDQRTWLAQEAAETAPIVSGLHAGLHPGKILWSSGKARSQKTEEQNRLVGQTPFLSVSRRASSGETEAADDLVLWTVSDQQRRKAGVLSTARAASYLGLRHGSSPLGDQEANVLEQKPSTIRSQQRF